MRITHKRCGRNRLAKVVALKGITPHVGQKLVLRGDALGGLRLESLRLSANFRAQAALVEWVRRQTAIDHVAQATRELELRGLAR